ncbi:MAG: hypothetical protein RIR62_162 [Pseudomonadota bacterium]
MVTPRRDHWTVQGRKPADRALFDSIIDQPFRRAVARLTGRDASNLLYEMFDTEDEARRYAGLARAAGAINVRTLPPLPVQGRAKPLRLRRYLD